MISRCTEQSTAHAHLWRIVVRGTETKSTAALSSTTWWRRTFCKYQSLVNCLLQVLQTSERSSVVETTHSSPAGIVTKFSSLWTSDTCFYQHLNIIGHKLSSEKHVLKWQAVSAAHGRCKRPFKRKHFCFTSYQMNCQKHQEIYDITFETINS